MSDTEEIPSRARRKDESEKEEQEELDAEEQSSKEDKIATDDENIKLALASFFYAPSAQGDGDVGGSPFNIEDIPEKVRPILLEKWKRLRSDLDSSKPRGTTDPKREDAGSYCLLI